MAEIGRRLWWRNIGEYRNRYDGTAGLRVIEQIGLRFIQVVMSRRYRDWAIRRDTLQRSLEYSGSGGCTTYAAKRMAEPLGGRPAESTITGRCRTFIFEFPGSCLVTKEAVGHQIIYCQHGLNSPWQNLDFSGLCSFRTLALRWPNDGFQERKTANRAGTTPRNAPKGDSWLSSAPLGPK